MRHFLTYVKIKLFTDYKKRFVNEEDNYQKALLSSGRRGYHGKCMISNFEGAFTISGYEFNTKCHYREQVCSKEMRCKSKVFLHGGNHTVVAQRLRFRLLSQCCSH